MEMSKGRWAGIAAGIAVVALCVWIWVQSPKSVAYETVEIPLPKGFSGIEELHINDYGIVAGILNGPESDHLFLWDREKGMTVLSASGFLSGRMMAITDVNNRDQLIGSFGLSNNDPNLQPGESSHGGFFFYDPITGFRDIGKIKGSRGSNVYALNDRGQVVSESLWSDVDGKLRWKIFLWSPESGFWDPNLIGRPQGFNNAGQIIGWNQQHQSYFLWSLEGTTEIPKPSPQRSIRIGCLNDSGQIIGVVEENNGNRDMPQMVLWDPRRGYHNAFTIGIHASEDSAILAMNDRKILFYEENQAFDWFGLRDQPVSSYRILVYTVGEKLMILKGIPKVGNPAAKSWNINREGWIVTILNDHAYVMIPKDQRKTKK